MDTTVFLCVAVVLAAAELAPAVSAAEVNSDSYHQVVEVIEDEGTIEAFVTSDPGSLDVQATFAEKQESLGPFQFGLRLDWTRRRRHVRLGEPVEHRDTPESLGSVVAAVAVREGMSVADLQDRLERHLESELRTATPQTLLRRWRGLRSLGLFVDERMTRGMKTEYVVLLCSREGEATTARVVLARDGNAGLEMEMELLPAVHGESPCDDLESSFSADPVWTLEFREPVSIEGRELRMTYTDQTSDVVASLPDGVAFGPALERAGVDLARERESGTVWVQAPGRPVTPPVQIDPESDLDASRYLGRFALSHSRASYGMHSSREDEFMGDILAAWMFTGPSSESTGKTIESELRRRVQLTTRPLTMASVEEVISSIAVDGSFTVICAQPSEGARSAGYVVGGETGPILSPDPVCEALEEAVPHPYSEPPGP